MGDAEETADGSDADKASHALSPEELNYPTLEFETGEIDSEGGFDLSRELDYDEMGEWAEAVAGALESHDLGISTPAGFLTFGIAPDGVDATFDSDENNRGTLELTFRLSAKAMFVADADDEVVGSRGDVGFVPLSMLSDDRETYRCYSWIDDAEDPE